MPRFRLRGVTFTIKGAAGAKGRVPDELDLVPMDYCSKNGLISVREAVGVGQEPNGSSRSGSKELRLAASVLRIKKGRLEPVGALPAD